MVPPALLEGARPDLVRAAGAVVAALGVGSEKRSRFGTPSRASGVPPSIMPLAEGVAPPEAAR
eukprot:5337626-Pyramimonas_sp.AAC.1